MARVTYSALVSDMSGKVGDVVFSRWKGRKVVRNRVTPANPRSVAQTIVRVNMALVVAWWSRLSVALKTAIGVLAASESISGFNGFTKRCMRDMNAVPTPQAPRFVPHNTDVLPITELASEPTVGSKSVTLTWVDGGSPVDATVEIYACPSLEPDYTATLVNVTGEPSLVSSGTRVVVLPEGATLYHFFALVKTADAAPEYSLAAHVEGMSSVE